MPRLASIFTAAFGMMRASRRLDHDQWLTGQGLADLRSNRLRRMLARATAAPFYRSALETAGRDLDVFEPSDLPRLPLVDREVIANHGIGSFLTRSPAGLFSVTTSGSTGTPGRFFRSGAEEAEYSARWMRVYRAYGCGLRDAQINLATVGKPDRPGPITLLRGAGLLPRVERLPAGAPPAEVLARVQALHPPILTGYAGAIEALADHLLATGAAAPAPKAVFCTAMEVTDRCLAVARQAFHAPAVDVYVSNEFGVIAWSCPVRHDVLHVDDDSLVLEVLDEDGDPAPPGTTGELVITSLVLTAMPLVRYRTGDMAAWLPERCECGRGLGLITRVQGRTAHAIPRPGGGRIVTPLVTSLFGRAKAYEWVRRFQVREGPGNHLRFLLEPRQSPTAAQRAALVLSLEQELGTDFSLALELVEVVPPTASGKLQFLVPLAGSPLASAR